MVDFPIYFASLMASPAWLSERLVGFASRTLAWAATLRTLFLNASHFAAVFRDPDREAPSAAVDYTGG